jgi:uncharacterized protein (DUF1015 family)
MAVLSPFRALRYAAPPAPDLSPLIAPPYDVIDGAARRRLAAHPHNIVHVDLPEAGGSEDVYERAAAILARWVREEVLARDPTESLYVMEQDFGDAGARRTRRGLFARLRLEPFENGVVVPHERTLAAPRTDRTRLLAATRTHLSPVFFLHPDPGARIAAFVSGAATGDPVATGSLGGENRVRLWRISDAAAVQALLRLFEEQWVLIADGHHRYESALALAAEAGPAARVDHVLAFLCSVSDPGLRILPIHRLIPAPTGRTPAEVRQSLTAWFEITPVEDPGTLSSRIGAEAGRTGVFGLKFGGEPGGWIARWRDGAGIASASGGPGNGGLTGAPAPLARLDVVLLHRLVLERALGLDTAVQAGQRNIEFHDDASAVLERGRNAFLAILVNPTRLEQVIEVSRQGLRLPQKSTFFHPKVPAGLVLDPLDAPSGV